MTMIHHAPALRPVAKTRSAFVDIGRAIAALVVFYQHVEGLFIREQHGTTLASRAADSLLGSSSEMNADAYAHIAVGIFFLASGFVMTPIVLRMGGKRFAVNRVFRIYPLLFFTVVLSAVAVWAGWQPLTTGTVDGISAGMLLSNLTLANFAMTPFGALVGVAWTLAIEMLYYALLILVLPLLRQWMWLAIFVQLELMFIAVLVHAQLGDAYAGFASLCAFVLVPIMGQIVWAGWHGRIPGWLACLYLVAAWAIMTWADPTQELHNDYGLHIAAVGLALLVFLVGLGMESRLSERPIWREMSERVYSLYLLHGVVAFPIMYGLVEFVSVWLAVLAGVVATFVVVEFAYVLIERPSHNLGRMLSGRPTYGRRQRQDRPAQDGVREGVAQGRKRE